MRIFPGSGPEAPSGPGHNALTWKQAGKPRMRHRLCCGIVGLAKHTSLRAGDGTEVAIEDRAAPIRNHRCEVVGAVMGFRDVTQRRAADRALQRNEQLLTDFFDCEWRSTAGYSMWS